MRASTARAWRRSVPWCTAWTSSSAIYNPTPGQSGGVSQSDYETKGDDWIRKTYPQINFITNSSLGRSRRTRYL